MNELYDTLRDRLAAELSLLPDKPEETPDSTLRALWHFAAGVPCSAQLALERSLPELDVRGRARLQDVVARRLAGTPLAHITERQRFVDMEMLAGADALVPRKETELLARAAIEFARQLALEQDSLKVVDVCTGCGNVALAIARHAPSAYVFGADLSEQAVALARRNAAHLGLESRTEFRAGDLLAPFESGDFLGEVDLLTCNPPYISSAKVTQMPGEIAGHEPHLAFDGGPFGVAILMRLLQDAPRFLRGGGWLAFEIGLGQGPAMAKRLEKAGAWSEVRALHDEAGMIRALAARH